MRLRFSPIIFSAAYCAAYITVLACDWPMFIYYPQEEVWAWGWARRTDVGPGMAWYGLMAVAFIIAILASYTIPARAIPSGARGWLWLIPFAAMASCLFLMRLFFLY